MELLDTVTLQGELVTLTPLAVEDHDGLVAAAADGELWTVFYTRVPAPDQMRETIATYLELRDAGMMLPFTVRLVSTGAIVGLTTYCNIDARNVRVEIGYTWYAASAQRTGVNAECKLLLLGHAFDRLGVIAVELRTHWLNQQSRRAIERLGARQDGVLRNHSVMADGTLRDTVVFSIIPSEWPAIRNELRRRLDNRSPAR